MTWLWIPFTVMAAFMQAWRNAFQNQLRRHVSTLGVTLARFIVASPLSGLYLWVLYQCYPDAVLPHFSPTFLVCVVIAAIAQIAATAFMVMLFQSRNYAIGVGLAKSEAIIAAGLGALFFVAPLSGLAWLGVFIGALAVWLMGLKRTTAATTDSYLSLKTVATGLASGLCFALCTLYIREAALILRHDDQLGFLLSAAWVLFSVLLTQTLLLCIWLFFREPQALRSLYTHKKQTVNVSVFSLLGSIGWFTAMSLQTVAMVKTLGQIEIVFTLAISAWWFKDKLGRSDYLGLLLIVVSAVLVILA